MYLSSLHHLSIYHDLLTVCHLSIHHLPIRLSCIYYLSIYHLSIICLYLYVLLILDQKFFTELCLKGLVVEKQNLKVWFGLM